jgi:hypothetical protein
LSRNDLREGARGLGRILGAFVPALTGGRSRNVLISFLTAGPVPARHRQDRAGFGRGGGACNDAHMHGLPCDCSEVEMKVIKQAGEELWLGLALAAALAASSFGVVSIREEGPRAAPTACGLEVGQ